MYLAVCDVQIFYILSDTPTHLLYQLLGEKSSYLNVIMSVSIFLVSSVSFAICISVF